MENSDKRKQAKRQQREKAIKEPENSKQACNEQKIQQKKEVEKVFQRDESSAGWIGSWRLAVHQDSPKYAE